MAENTGAGAGGENTGTETRTIPYDRFSTVVSERNTLKDRVAELERQLQGAAEKAATADTLAGQLREAQAKHAADSEAWGLEKGILGAGITDPEGLDFARLAYQRVQPGADGKKPSITDWLAARDALPRAVLAYLPAQAQGQQGGAQGQQGQGQRTGNPPPNANAGTKSYTGSPGTFTPEAISRMTPAEYKAAREAILAQQAKR